MTGAVREAVPGFVREAMRGAAGAATMGVATVENRKGFMADSGKRAKVAKRRIGRCATVPRPAAARRVRAGKCQAGVLRTYAVLALPQTARHR
ncbi:hypothetical protein GCM10023144_20520 [Pigmentiphaga soli]|uniref:Uncharacterized protein n=1 Tax=Pigmentiphaga soli TaxID=1007095 RepID=A0ABP8GYD1_9BURK